MNQLEEINEESDHDDGNPSGYYTRAKRRKLSEKCQNTDEFCYTKRSFKSNEQRKRKNPIMFMPTEVLENIFKRISYHELSMRIRLVNRRFRVIAEDVLNLGFKRLDKKILGLLNSTEISLGFTQDDMEIKCISKLLCILEILRFQYSIIVATIWRYVYNDCYKAPRFCMYGGMIIDTHETVIWKFSHCPNELYAPAVLRDYALPQEVMKIIQMTKTFCVHFDKANEETTPNACLMSGCKILDILDCAKFAQKMVYFERKTGELFLAKYSYFFKNSWFIAMPIPSSKDMDWSHKQRMMHMRLRRIVLAHNDMHLQQEQYQRETALRPNPLIVIKKPGNNVYTGYGDVEDTFFYYGVMNDGAFMQKFHLNDDNEEPDDEEVVQDFAVNNRGDNELVQVNSDEDILYRLPFLGFKVDVTVCCSPSFAPLRILKSLSQEESHKLSNRYTTKENTHIHMDFECVGAHYARLPTTYRYDFNSKMK